MMQGGYWRTPMVVIGKVENDEEKLRQLEWDAQKFCSTFKWGDRFEDFIRYKFGMSEHSVLFGDFLIWQAGCFMEKPAEALLYHFVSEVTL